MAQPFTIACFGTAVLDVGFDRRWKGIISGGGGTGAAAAAILSQAWRIIAVTTLRSGHSTNIIHDTLYRRFKKAGVEVMSQPEAKIRIGLCQPPGVVKFSPTERFRDDFVFDPASIPGIDRIAPDAAVFIGASTVFGEKWESSLELARELKRKGALIIFDPNPRSQVEPAICEYWAGVADIVKIGQTELSKGYLGPASATAQDLAADYIRRGTKLVCHTQGKDGCTFYWEEGGSIQSLHVDQRNPLDNLELEMGGGDAADVSFALASQRLGFSGRTFSQWLNASGIAKIGECVMDGAAKFLIERNKPIRVRHELLRPVITRRDAQRIVDVEYPRQQVKYEYT